MSLPQAFASLPSNLAAALPSLPLPRASSSSDRPPSLEDEQPIESAKCYTIRHLMRKYGKLYVMPRNLVFKSSLLVDPLFGSDKLTWSFADDIVGKPELMMEKPGFVVWVTRSGTRGSSASPLSASNEPEDPAGQQSDQSDSEDTGTRGTFAPSPLDSASNFPIPRAGTATSVESDTAGQQFSPVVGSPGTFDAVLPGVIRPAPVRAGSSSSISRQLGPKRRSLVETSKRKVVFIFNSSEARNRCYAALLAQMGYQFDPDATSPQSRPSSPAEPTDFGAIRAITPPPRDDAADNVLKPLRSSESVTVTSVPASRTPSSAGTGFSGLITSSFSKIFSPSSKVSPVSATGPRAPSIVFVPTSQRITILTVGSRGDVQPFIALGKRLKDEGNRVAIATHPEFAKWIRSHGLKFRPVKGEPGMIMAVMSENGHSTYQFVKEANAKLRPWLTDLMMSGFEACQGSDVVLAGPSAIVGPHVAEALGLPFMFVMPMPWTKTKAFPHPFITPPTDLGGLYNELSYSIVERAIYIALLITLNKWRKHVLGVPPTTLAGPVDPVSVPTLYCYSPSVLPKPADW
jgi:hypothetical protein